MHALRSTDVDRLCRQGPLQLQGRLAPRQCVSSISSQFDLDDRLPLCTRPFAAQSRNGWEFRRNAPNRAKAWEELWIAPLLQNVRCRLKWRLAHLVHADRVPAVFTSHKSTACNVSGRGVHALRLRCIGERCREHWYRT
jgi:hypothetical protein